MIKNKIKIYGSGSAKKNNHILDPGVKKGNNRIKRFQTNVLVFYNWYG